LTDRLATELMGKGHEQYEIKLFLNSFEVEICYYPYREFSNCTQRFYNAYVTKSGKNGIITGQFIRDAVHYRDLGKAYVAPGFVNRMLDEIQDAKKIQDKDDRDLVIKSIAEQVRSLFESNGEQEDEA
jgi:hypothetical protein